MSGWLLIEDAFVPELAPWRDSLYSVANGYLGTRGSFEEGMLGEVRATFINGVFVTPSGELPVLGAVPDWTKIGLWIDGEPFSLMRRPAGYRRTLDLERGMVERIVLWQGAETGVVKVRFRRFVSMAAPHLAALEATVTALTGPVEVRIETGIDAVVPSPVHPAWAPTAVSRTGPGEIRMNLSSIDDAHRLRVETTVRGLADLEYVADKLHPRLGADLRLEPGRSVSFTKFTAYRTSADPPAETDLPPADMTFDRAAVDSSHAWARRWKASRIDVDGDPAAELALRFAAFQLVGAAAPSGDRAAIGARLMSGFGYRHHVFWDTDIFIIPYFTIAQPDLAHAHLSYRYRGLGGARRKAAHHGRTGAFFAWESADSGDETSPSWSSPLAGEPVRIWTGELEEHIVADIAFAVDHYWRWTGDDEFMVDRGAEIVLDGARYWAHRVEVDGDRAHVSDVIGPDEYHTHVVDSFFTNVMAAWHLRRAAEVAEWLRRSAPGAAERVGRTLPVGAADPWAWRDLADRIVLRGDGIWEQHDGFFGLTEVRLADFEPRHRSMYDLLGEKVVEQSQVIKQADVVMAIALLGDAVGDSENQRANWDYYVRRTDHGSSLSPAVHSLVASRLGLAEEAFDFFKRTIDIDFEDAMGNGRDGVHAATQGGLLQAALFGFAGLSLRGDEPLVESRLPHHWKSLGFSFVYRGRRYERNVGRPSGSGRTGEAAVTGGGES